MSLSLVADYDSNSSEDENETNHLKKEEPVIQLASALEMLDENNSNISSSVFSNPYREAENYEQSLLERHVKMTTVKEISTVEQKKICFKFLKGKCRLGTGCRFLHQNPHSISNHEEKDNSDSENPDTETTKPVKKRCGLKDDLIPPKKYMKSYYQKK